MVVLTNEEVIHRLPERRNVIRTINRTQNRTRPPIPQELSSVEIISPYDRTITGDPFLQLDTGALSEERVIIFYSPQALEHLCHTNIILGDGTFKTVPKIFYQLYTLHGLVHGHIFPLVYALTNRKSQETYSIIFEHLKEAAGNSGLRISAEYFLADFELATLNAFAASFPHIQRHGCLFHHSQAIWRFAVQQCSLKVPYSNDQDMRDAIHCLLALPFVPVADVEETFQIIYLTVPDSVLPLADYIDVTYIGGRRLRGRVTRARYPIELWNVSELVRNRVARTTNSVEGWHSRFQRMMLVHHATLWKFMEKLRLDQKENEVMIMQLEAGHSRIKYPIKNKYLLNMEQLENIVERYEVEKSGGRIINYLKAIAYKIKLYNVDETSENSINE